MTDQFADNYRDPDYEYPVPPREQQAPADDAIVSMPFDPVLRQALIDKGVLTPADLRQAEEKIRVISGMVNAHGRQPPV